MEEQKSSNKMIIGIIVVILIAAATTGVIVWNSRSSNQQTVSDDTNQTTQQSTSGTSDTGSTASSNDQYKDGTYTAEGSYLTPGGREAIDVKVTLAGGVISGAEVTQKAISREARTYQAAFTSGYKAQVVGKKIDDVSLSRVSGSSLTPGGFNSALDTIKSQAKA